jgi:hypothetical protein
MKTKRVFWGFLSTDYKAMEKYLEEMAKKGWMLEKLGVLTAKFRRIEPKNLKFYIDVFEDKSFLFRENSMESEEYRKLCEESGWTFITSKYYLQFFYAEEGQEPTPIQTDEALEQTIVKSSLLKRVLLVNTNLVFYILLFSYIFKLFPISHINLLSYSGIAITIVTPLIFVLLLLKISYYIYWNKTYKRNTSKRLGMKKRPSLKGAKRRAILFNGLQWLVLLLLFLIFIGDALFISNEYVPILIGTMIIIAATVLLSFFIKKAKTEEKSIQYLVFGAIILLFILPMAISYNFADTIDKDQPIYQEDIPEDYPIVTKGELTGTDVQEGKILWWDFQPRMSPIVPLSYDCHGTKFVISYYRAINSYFADIVFDGKTKERQRILGYMNKTTIKDKALRQGWDVEKLILSEDRDELLIQRDNIVLYLSGDIDFEKEAVKERIHKEFFD